MKSLVCPISDQTANQCVVRLTALIIASAMTGYMFSRSIVIVGVILVDFFIRAYTEAKFSPASWLASRLCKLFRIQPEWIDKAPKIFASRLGMLFSILIVILHYLHPLSALIVAGMLTGFALLESLCSFCVGCIIYSYIVLPVHNRRAKK